jgi:D-sedoheptulose 7-phosphate isomerase
MTFPVELLKKNINLSISAKSAFLTNDQQLNIFNKASKIVLECYQNGGRLYIAGNGGSAADAQHLAAEFVSKLAKDRAPLPAEALTVDTSVLTAIANDYGYEQIFARQIMAKITNQDIFLGITTSGNSQNIIKALEVCRAKKIKTILFTGHDGGVASKLADYSLIVPVECTATIQELHIVLAHSLCAYIEAEIFKN